MRIIHSVLGKHNDVQVITEQIQVAIRMIIEKYFNSGDDKPIETLTKRGECEYDTRTSNNITFTILSIPQKDTCDLFVLH